MTIDELLDEIEKLKEDRITAFFASKSIQPRTASLIKLSKKLDRHDRNIPGLSTQV